MNKSQSISQFSYSNVADQKQSQQQQQQNLQLQQCQRICTAATSTKLSDSVKSPSVLNYRRKSFDHQIERSAPSYHSRQPRIASEIFQGTSQRSSNSPGRSRISLYRSKMFKLNIPQRVLSQDAQTGGQKCDNEQKKQNQLIGSMSAPKSIHKQLKSFDFNYQSAKSGHIDNLNQKQLTKQMRKDSKMIKKFLKLKKFKNAQKQRLQFVDQLFQKDFAIFSTRKKSKLPCINSLKKQFNLLQQQHQQLQSQQLQQNDNATNLPYLDSNNNNSNNCLTGKRSSISGMMSKDSSMITLNKVQNSCSNQICNNNNNSQNNSIICRSSIKVKRGTNKKRREKQQFLEYLQYNSNYNNSKKRPHNMRSNSLSKQL